MSYEIKKDRTAVSSIYLKDSSYLKPKEMFKFIERLSFNKKNKKIQLEVGLLKKNS